MARAGRNGNSVGMPGPRQQDAGQAVGMLIVSNPPHRFDGLLETIPGEIPVSQAFMKDRFTIRDLPGGRQRVTRTYNEWRFSQSSTALVARYRPPKWLENGRERLIDCKPLRETAL